MNALKVLTKIIQKSIENMSKIKQLDIPIFPLLDKVKCPYCENIKQEYPILKDKIVRTETFNAKAVDKIFRKCGDCGKTYFHLS